MFFILVARYLCYLRLFLEIESSQSQRSLTPTSFLIPGDRSICQNDWMSFVQNSRETGSGGKGAGDAGPAQSDGLKTVRISSRCDEYHSTPSLCVYVWDTGHTKFPSYINSHFSIWRMLLSSNSIIAACIKVAPSVPVRDSVIPYLLMAYSVYGINIWSAGSCLTYDKASHGALGQLCMRHLPLLVLNCQGYQIFSWIKPLQPVFSPEAKFSEMASRPTVFSAL